MIGGDDEKKKKGGKEEKKKKKKKKKKKVRLVGDFKPQGGTAQGAPQPSKRQTKAPLTLKERLREIQEEPLLTSLPFVEPLTFFGLFRHTKSNEYRKKEKKKLSKIPAFICIMRTDLTPVCI